jgi:hypothetical protein
MGVVPRPLTAVLQISSSWSQPLELTTNRKVGSLNLSVARRAFTLGGRTHREWHKWTLSQHGNGVADSLPSGSGNLDLQLWRQRLPFAHPLQPLEPVQDPIDLTAQVRLVAYQTRTSRIHDKSHFVTQIEMCAFLDRIIFVW